MPKKLTQQEFEDRVALNSENLYEVVSEYQGKTKPITLRCKTHGNEFTLTADAVMRRNYVSCPECKKQKTQENQVKLECAYCGEIFYRNHSKTQNSKSGLQFCCREHKDLAQRLHSGFVEIQPAHYGNGVYSYRKLAFHEQEHSCKVCGYQEDSRILEVHHLDSNRQNNHISNLVILCPTCHRKITLGYYVLTDDFQLVNKGL